jgi:GLPGLI family protein
MLFFINPGSSGAQVQLPIRAGEITFERKINLSARLKEDVAQKSSRFKISDFKLIFSGGQTLYFPSLSATADPGPEMPAGSNIVFSDLASRTSVSEKMIFGKTFRVGDSMPNIQWKITPEKRVIAGFECRRANAIIMDSVYAVAFYCDDIDVSGGPESFSGLPGMILGVALPHEHITWFATTVSNSAPAAGAIKAPDTGEHIDVAGLRKICRGMLGQMAGNIQEVIKLILL